jgi:putative endonuclease
MPSSDRASAKSAKSSQTPMRRSTKQTKGAKFEQLAAEFFKANGFDIVERNWRSGHKEIDLIVKRENLLVFVEVKSSGTTKFGHPAERVDNRKIRNLTSAATAYLEKKLITGCDLRFDVVTFADGLLEHYPDAFREE